MKMMGIGKIPRPKHDVRNLNYEADCKSALGPLVADLLDRAEAAGWDRRKAATALVMFLAAGISPKGSPTPTAELDRADTLARSERRAT
jgi:hypothetical protein